MISGDVSGMCGEQIHCSGNDDESMYSEIWFRILLLNTPPTAHAGADQTYNEGDTIFLNGTYEDPNIEDTHTFLWHLASSTNGQSVPDVYAQDMSFIPYDNGVYTFSFTVTDNWGASGSDEVVITVNNVAPVLNIDHLKDEMGAEIGSDAPVTLIGLKTSLACSFTDAGTAEIQTAIDWLQSEQNALAEYDALDMLDRDNPFAAVQMMKRAILCLEKAEAADPQLDYSTIKGLLALSAKSLVVEVIADAEAVAMKSSELKKNKPGQSAVARGRSGLDG